MNITDAASRRTDSSVLDEMKPSVSSPEMDVLIPSTTAVGGSNELESSTSRQTDPHKQGKRRYNTYIRDAASSKYETRVGVY